MHKCRSVRGNQVVEFTSFKMLPVTCTTVSVLNFVGKISMVCQRQICNCIKFRGYNFRGISTSQFIFSRICGEQNSFFKVYNLYLSGTK